MNTTRVPRATTLLRRALLALPALLAVLAVSLVWPGAGTEAAPTQEVKKLTASDAQAYDQFGHSVSVSGDTAAVGAPDEDAGGGAAGAAYVFQRDQGGTDNWGQVTKLTASDAEAGDNFGYSVAISGDTAVVGAAWEDTGASDAGAAYVFQRDQGGTDNWGQVTKLTASDAQAENRFGYSVAISGDTAVVGADQQGVGSPVGAGAAYVFGRDQGGPDNWGQVTKLTASDAQVGDSFGGSVAISGNTAIVGARFESNVGAAYVFGRDQGGADNWGEVKKLTASDAGVGDSFGGSVAVSGDTAIVGAETENAGGFAAGAAYVFGRDQGGADNWGEVKKLTASDAQTYDRFGESVAISGDTAVVGARYEDAGGDAAGAAYVFGRDEDGADNWGEVKKLTASDAEDFDWFGFSVAISGDSAIVGAAAEGAGGSYAGAAYVFGEPPPALSLDIKSGAGLLGCDAPSTPGKCVALVGGGAFTVSVEVNRAPSGNGYVAFGTTLDYSGAAISYKPRGVCQPTVSIPTENICQPDLGQGGVNVEVVWPDGDGFITRDPKSLASSNGSVEHRAAACLGTFYGDPCTDDSSTFEGNVIELEFNCVSEGTGTISFDTTPGSNGFVIDKAFEPYYDPTPDQLVYPEIENSLTIRCVLTDTDNDLDGCTDVAELQPKGNASTGGGRDPNNPWDFYDVAGPYVGPPHSWPPDQYIDLFNDIQGVMLKYQQRPEHTSTVSGQHDIGVGLLNVASVSALNPGQNGIYAGDVIVIDPDGANEEFVKVTGIDGNELTLSLPTTKKHVDGETVRAYLSSYDRGPSSGPNVWNMTEPDGTIDLFNDILGVISQYQHDCR